MTQVPSLQTIRAKKEALLASAAKYEALAAKARTEAADYEAAERVWLKLVSSETPVNSEGSSLPATEPRVGTGDAYMSVGGAPFVKVERTKPTGIPPVPDMIIEALTEASGNLNVDGLSPSALLTFVRQKYWPEATNQDVGSTAWRMWKDGRLARPSTGIYALPAKNSPPEPMKEQEVISG